MKHFGLFILTLGLSSSAFGAACVQGGTFASYATAGSCTFTAAGQTYTLQDFTFLSVAVLTGGEGAGNFTVSESSNGNGPVVTITPITGTSISTNLVATETLLFGFDIVSNSSNIGFTNVNLGEQSSLSGLVGTSGTIAEEDCYGGLLPLPGSVNVASLGSGGLACLGGGLSVGAGIALTPGVNANANVNIPLNTGFTNSVDVLKEFNLTADGALLTTATASVSSITQSFSTNAPEPGSLVLGGCGLLIVGIALRRRNKSSFAGHSCTPSK